MKIYDQLKEVLENKYSINDIITIQEIKDILKHKYGTNQESLILSDYCYNRYNNGINFTKHIFEYLDDGKYKYLGENYIYTGKIVHNEKGTNEEKIVGYWENGKHTIDLVIKPVETVDIESIERYLESNVGKSYTKPDKAGANAKEMIKLKEEGIYARKQFSELAKRALVTFQDYEAGSCSGWINQGQTVPKFFWIEFKKKDKKDIKSSISILAVIENNSVLFYIALEVRNSSKEDYDRHNKIVYENNNNPELYYHALFKDGSYKNLQGPREDIIKRYEAGDYTKIMMQKNISGPYSNILSEKIIAQIQGAFRELEPFYKVIIGDENPLVKNTTNLNTILYGPPGTGKTYNTVNYAVAIIENKSIEQVLLEDYTLVFERYIKYKNDKIINFTTFHQSYGYEEFIEGIKPVMKTNEETDHSEISYEIKAGVFKEFCERANTLVVENTNKYGIRNNPVIWKVSLASAKENPVRRDCFNNDRIRIGWDGYGKDITDQTDYTHAGQEILDRFMNQIVNGDIVFNLFDERTIDAIGVVQDDYEWLDDVEVYKRSRKVKWIIKDIHEDIFELMVTMF